MVTVAVLLFSMVQGAFALGAVETGIRVVFTSSLNGNLDGCACGSVPRSGLVKRAAYLKSNRQSGDILIDTGDIFDSAPDELLSRHIIETYADLDYKTVAVGDQEFSNGIDGFWDLRKTGRFLCNNLSIRARDGTATAFSEEPLLIRSGSVSFGVVALLGPETLTLYPKDLKNSLVLADPLDTARRSIAELRSRGAACIILLYHGTVESGMQIISEVSGINIMIVGHEQRLIAPRRIGSTILASPGEEGNRVGVISLRMDPGTGAIRGFTGSMVELSYLHDPDDSAVRARIESYKQELRARLR